MTDPTKDLARPSQVTITIDGITTTVPAGSRVIRAAEMIGIDIPRFCDHPLLEPMGSCRQCLVEVPDMGNGRGMPKPQTACTLTVAPGMQVQTQHTSEVARRAQTGILELLLINHPLDCPICDKGGECPLQNQALAWGPEQTRYQGVKRTYPKPVSISAEILLDRERCVLCARCTRFSEQIAGDPFISLFERGALQQIGIYADQPYNSYFSGNIVQICPVGALTSESYRFQSRPFDLVSTLTTCEHCAAGCQLRTDHRHYQVKRRQAGDLPDVNEEWSCDRGRFGFLSGRGDDRLTYPLVRFDGELRRASWPEAINAAVAGLRAAAGRVGVLTGGRLTLEDSYGYAKFARCVLGTNNIDCRARPYGYAEAEFLATRVAGCSDVTYADLEKTSSVILLGLEAEEEAPMIFLRLRKAVRKNGLKVITIAPFLSDGARKLNAELVRTAPGDEPLGLSRSKMAEDTIILMGERAGLIPGTLAAVVKSGARFAWVPRRAGERGAIEAGCLPNLLTGGRLVTDAQARVDLMSVWGVPDLPGDIGLDAEAQLAAAADGTLAALVVAGVDPADMRDAALARHGLDAAFVISIEQRLSDVARRADVVFPVALIEEHAGTFLNWEGRAGAVTRVIGQNTTPMTDLRVLAALADALGTPLGVRTAKAARAEIEEIGAWAGDRPYTPMAEPALPLGEVVSGEVILATWRQLLDRSSGTDGADALRHTAKPAVARINNLLARRLRVEDGDLVSISTSTGSVTLPVIVSAISRGTVWVPQNTTVALGEALGAAHGDVVTLTAGGSA